MHEYDLIADWYASERVDTTVDGSRVSFDRELRRHEAGSRFDEAGVSDSTDTPARTQLPS